MRLGKVASQVARMAAADGQRPHGGQRQQTERDEELIQTIYRSQEKCVNTGYDHLMNLIKLKSN